MMRGYTDPAVHEIANERSSLISRQRGVPPPNHHASLPALGDVVLLSRHPGYPKIIVDQLAPSSQKLDNAAWDCRKVFPAISSVCSKHTCATWSIRLSRRSIPTSNLDLRPTPTAQIRRCLIYWPYSMTASNRKEYRWGCRTISSMTCGLSVTRPLNRSLIASG